MPSEFFDGNTLRRITGIYKSGRNAAPDFQTVIYRDTECAGLAIKAQRKGAVWFLLTNDCNCRIGDFHLFGVEDLPTLRKLVAEAKDILLDGEKVKELFAAFLKKRDVAAARDIHDVKVEGAITWEQARDDFLIWAKKHFAPSTAEGYKSALGASKNSVYKVDFEHLEGMPVKSITFLDLSRIKESIIARGLDGQLKGTGLRQADLTIAAVRSCFRFLTDKPSTYGLIENVSLGLLNVREEEENARISDSGLSLRAMTQIEIGAFIHGLNYIPVKQCQMALFLQLLTGQRRWTAVSARRDSFVENPAYGLTWRMNAKGQTWRVLPLSPMARDVVLQCLEDFVEHDNAHLFPQERRRRKDDDKSGPIHQRTVSKHLEAMREPGGVFAGSEISPATHDFRRAFITYFRPRMHHYSIGGRQLNSDDIKMITHVNEGREGSAALAYDKNQYLDVKLAILTEWERYCMEGYTLYMAQLDAKKAA